MAAHVSTRILPAPSAAARSIDHVASYVGLLAAALADDPAFYARLVRRGFLLSAIEYVRHAASIQRFDERPLLDALHAARDAGIPDCFDRDLAMRLLDAQQAIGEALAVLRAPR